MKDYANEEVRGLSRYIPTKIAKTLLIALITIPFATFKFFYSTFDFESLHLSLDSKFMLSISLALSVALIIALSLILELSTTAYQAKHRRIIHFTNEHPLMTPKWLYQNASFSHWLSLAFLCSLMFSTGYFTAIL